MATRVLIHGTGLGRQLVTGTRLLGGSKLNLCKSMSVRFATAARPKRQSLSDSHRTRGSGLPSRVPLPAPLVCDRSPLPPRMPVELRAVAIAAVNATSCKEKGKGCTRGLRYRADSAMKRYVCSFRRL